MGTKKSKTSKKIHKKLNAYGETTGKKKKRLFLAEEVCYGLAVGMQLGFSDRDNIEWVLEDLQNWSKYTLPKESKTS